MKDNIPVSDESFYAYVPLGSIVCTNRGYVMKTDKGVTFVDGRSLRKEDFPGLYAVLSMFPKRSRWQRLKDWWNRTVPEPFCAYGEDEETFRVPDMRVKVFDYEQ